MFLIPVLFGAVVVVSACMDADDKDQLQRAAFEEKRKWAKVTEPGPMTQYPRGGTEGWVLGEFPALGLHLWLTPAEATFIELAEDLDDDAAAVLRFIVSDQANRGPGR